LGRIQFKKGWYVYTGSARKNLSQRIQRHLRRIRKKKHWHLDYLIPAAALINAFPVMSYRNLECDMARALKALGGTGIQGFGCSDCSCPSHLYYFSNPPMENPAFIAQLLQWRHIDGLTNK
jgi:sugar fermentation stimulation protein A